MQFNLIKTKDLYAWIIYKASLKVISRLVLKIVYHHRYTLTLKHWCHIVYFDWTSHLYHYRFYCLKKVQIHIIGFCLNDYLEESLNDELNVLSNKLFEVSCIIFYLRENHQDHNAILYRKISYFSKELCNYWWASCSTSVDSTFHHLLAYYK